MFKILKKSEFKIPKTEYLNDNEAEDDIRKMIDEIKENGDAALEYYTEKYDKAKIKNFKLSNNEIQDAYYEVDKNFIMSIKKAKKNIEKYHKKEISQSWFSYENDGSILGQKITPIKRVGLYVPGGTASYPSSVLMTAIPGKIAGVEELVMCSPTDSKGKLNPYTIVAACESGINEIYKLGGAQAIIAMAIGTKTIPKAYKIVGPGNKYVTIAKKMVYGIVDIDMIAGPSEIMIIADENANPKYVAADLISQAEHDPLSSCYLITTSLDLAEEVKLEVIKQTEKLERKNIIKESFANMSYAIIVDSLEDGIKICNEIAPEHLELMLKQPFDYLGKIENAGAIFLGEFSPEPLGDYFAGPSHVLPTGGSAKYFSVLGVGDFMKKTTVISYSKKRLADESNDIIEIANKEGLTGHANSIKIRKLN